MVRDLRDRQARRDAEIARSSQEVFDLRPAAIRRDLDLHRPIYQKTAAYGHFGRDDHDFTWERVDRADALREAAGTESLGAAGRSLLAPRRSARPGRNCGWVERRLVKQTILPKPRIPGSSWDRCRFLGRRSCLGVE